MRAGLRLQPRYLPALGSAGTSTSTSFASSRSLAASCWRVGAPSATATAPPARGSLLQFLPTGLFVSRCSTPLRSQTSPVRTLRSSSPSFSPWSRRAAPATAAVTRLQGRSCVRLVAATTRRYVTLNELQRGGKLHLVYTGPHPSTIRTPAARRPYRQVFLRDVLILCTALIFTPFCSHLVSYLAGMDKAAFERVMLWWLKYREKGALPPHTGYLIVDEHELQKVLETKLGRPYTMEILETRLDDKIHALVDNMDGVELLIISGKKTFGSITIPFLTIGIHARIRWTETVKIVGPNGIAHLNVTLRTISNPDKRDLSTQLLGRSRRVLIEKVELAFADSTSYVLSDASFGRQKRYPAAKLKD